MQTYRNYRCDQLSQDALGHPSHHMGAHHASIRRLPAPYHPPPPPPVPTPKSLQVIPTRLSNAQAPRSVYSRSKAPSQSRSKAKHKASTECLQPVASYPSVAFPPRASITRQSIPIDRVPKTAVPKMGRATSYHVSTSIPPHYPGSNKRPAHQPIWLRWKKPRSSVSSYNQRLVSSSTDPQPKIAFEGFCRMSWIAPLRRTRFLCLIDTTLHCLDASLRHIIWSAEIYGARVRVTPPYRILLSKLPCGVPVEFFVYDRNACKLWASALLHASMLAPPPEPHPYIQENTIPKRGV